MADIGGYSPSVGPERYLGRYSNTALGFAAWTYLTSASFYNAASSTDGLLAASLQFLGLSIYNLGASPFYLLLPRSILDTPSIGSAILVLPNTRVPLTLDVGAIATTPTPATTVLPHPPTGILTLAIRGDVDTSTASNIVIQASFAGPYGPS
jgi:hypothetical protein